MQPPAAGPDEMMLVTLNDGNIGDHSVRGMVTRTFYGYKSSGDEMLVHRSDVQAQPHKFSVVQQRKEAMKPAEPPPPPPAPFDFTQLKGVGEKTADELRKRGVRSLRGLVALGEERLSEIVSPATAKKVIQQAKDELDK